MNPLTDLLPPKARAVLYAIVAAAGVVYGIWQASNQDWRQFTVAVIAALTGALAGSNVKPKSDADAEPVLDGAPLSTDERMAVRAIRAAD